MILSLQRASSDRIICLVIFAQKKKIIQQYKQDYWSSKFASSFFFSYMYSFRSIWPSYKNFKDFHYCQLHIWFEVECFLNYPKSLHYANSGIASSGSSDENTNGCNLALDMRLRVSKLTSHDPVPDVYYATVLGFTNLLMILGEQT